MVFRKQFKISLYVLIPFVIVGFSLLSFILAFSLGQASKTSSLTTVMAFLLAIMTASGGLGLIIARFVLRPIEKFYAETKKSSQAGRKVSGKKLFLEKDEIDRFEEAVNDVTDALPVTESQKLFPEIKGESRALRVALKQSLLVAPTDTTVLITGESGTGKELLASALHRLSKRNQGPFVAVNCVAIPEGLLESELFGHEKGAFTGAVSRRQGKFEAAHGGTIFLDEIGDMPPATQAKILRVLQERQFERLGGNEVLRAEARVIAATNQNLLKKVREGNFREDLYHRVNVFEIEMPPLQRRREDILPLARAFLGGEKQKSTEITPEAEKVLVAYDWPGNVRELKNAMERAVVLAAGGSIKPEHIPAEIRGQRAHWKETGLDAPLDEKLAGIEKGLIMEALRKTGGVQARAADLLGINQRSLWHRVKKYGIDAAGFKLPQ